MPCRRERRLLAALLGDGCRSLPEASGPRLQFVAFHREIDAAQPAGPEPGERLAGRHELRRAESSLVATGTLACPACDAPVLPGPGRMASRDPIACGFCGNLGAVRDFLSLAQPTRPTRVAVRVRGLVLR